MKKNKKLIFLFLIIILGGLLFIIYGKNEISHKIGRAKYLVTNPWKQDLNINKEYVAQIKAIQHIELRSFEKGYLQEIFVDEGQKVTKGQKMFQIMSLLMQAEFEKAKAEHQIANIEYVNTATLQRKNVVSANELALAKARLDKAKANMDLAQTHLGFTTISAPFEGIMDKFHVRLGSLLEEGELLTTISDNSKMWVYFNVSEADYLNYMELKNRDEHLPLSLVLANGKKFAHEGIIDTIEADFNNETGNIAFRASFPNPDGVLRHGETGNVLLIEPLKNVLVIPQKATFEILDKKFVYVVSDDGKIQSRQITIEREVPNLFIIASGIDKDDKILLEGLGRVKSGQTIKTQYQERADVIKSLELSVN